MILGLEHLSDQERAERKVRLDACVRTQQAGVRDQDPFPDPHFGELWHSVCAFTDDWSERFALIDAHLCVLASLGEMMVSKGVFGQRHLETAASLLSEFVVLDQTTNRAHRASRARLLRDRLGDVSLGAGERRALRLLATRIDLELELLEGDR